MLKGCGSLIGAFLALIGLLLLLRDCGAPRSPETAQPSKGAIETKAPVAPAPPLLGEMPKYRVTAKSGFTINLLVPPNTAREQLRTLIFSFREAREHKSFAKLIPTTQETWYNGPYSRLFIQVFDEPEWANEDKLKRVLGKTRGPGDLWKFNSAYNRHIRAEYSYETIKGGRWGEIGNLGCLEVSFLPDYEALFSVPLYP
jgi:hypothetical protein